MKHTSVALIALIALAAVLIYFVIGDNLINPTPKFKAGDCIKMIVPSDEFNAARLSLWTIVVVKVGIRNYQLKDVHGTVIEIDDIRRIDKTYQQVNCEE